jgi:hypothetical protein
VLKPEIPQDYVINSDRLMVVAISGRETPTRRRNGGKSDNTGNEPATFHSSFYDLLYVVLIYMKTSYRIY